jgi:hypothetical protein
MLETCTWPPESIQLAVTNFSSGYQVIQLAARSHPLTAKSIQDCIQE